MAPRRWPADMIVRHMASHTSMKLTGPDASRRCSAPARPRAAAWRSRDRCRRPAAWSARLPSRCRRWRARSSSIAPMTKQLKSVTLRPVPAPARMRPAGRKPKSAIAPWNRSRPVLVQPLAARPRSARRRATNVSSQRGVERRSRRRPASGTCRAQISLGRWRRRRRTVRAACGHLGARLTLSTRKYKRLRPSNVNKCSL